MDTKATDDFNVAIYANYNRKYLRLDITLENDEQPACGLILTPDNAMNLVKQIALAASTVDAACLKRSIDNVRETKEFFESHPDEGVFRA